MFPSERFLDPDPDPDPGPALGETIALDSPPLFL